MTSFFGELSTEDFLRDYWQKKPLYVPGALPGFRSPVSRDELFELASGDETDSRLIFERGGDYEWEARFGPFDAEEFDALDPSHWTLLVQEVDRLHAGTRRLLNHVPFLSNWQLDDVMVSYAADEGGVGAHIDQYDVFLIQGEGRRLWEIMDTESTNEEFIPDLDVRILANFDTTHSWTVEPGDLLYLPPRIPHRGTAVGESITISIGCRGPSEVDIVSGFFEEILSRQLREDPFKGASPLPETDTGTISRSLKEFAQKSISSLTQDDSDMTRWLGRYLSTPSRGMLPPKAATKRSEQDVHGLLRAGHCVRAASFSQVLYDRVDNETIVLFIAGEGYDFPIESATAIRSLCSREGLTVQDYPSNSDLAAFICDGINEGFFVLEPGQ